MASSALDFLNQLSARESRLGDADDGGSPAHCLEKIGSESRVVFVAKPDVTVDDDDLRPRLNRLQYGQEAGEFPSEEVPRLIGLDFSETHDDLMRGPLVGPPVEEHTGGHRNRISIVDIDASEHLVRNPRSRRCSSSAGRRGGRVKQNQIQA
jgi:hypothetical protein